MPDRPDQPRYAQIADDLGRQIDAGILGPGMPLPTQAELCAEFKVTRPTIGAVLRELERRGRIGTMKNRGSFVLPPTPTRVISGDRYELDLAAALAGATPDPTDPTLPRAKVSEVQADEQVARLFNIPVGTPLVCREWVSREGGRPVQITRTYLPLDLVPDRAAPLLGVGGSPMPYLVSVGVRPAEVTEVVASRAPTHDEESVLQPGTGQVFALTRRVLDADKRVVEVAREVVLSALGTELVYRVPLPKLPKPRR